MLTTWSPVDQQELAGRDGRGQIHAPDRVPVARLADPVRTTAAIDRVARFGRRARRRRTRAGPAQQVRLAPSCEVQLVHGEQLRDREGLRGQRPAALELGPRQQLEALRRRSDEPRGVTPEPLVLLCRDTCQGLLALRVARDPLDGQHLGSFPGVLDPALERLSHDAGKARRGPEHTRRIAALRRRGQAPVPRRGGAAGWRRGALQEQQRQHRIDTRMPTRPVASLVLHLEQVLGAQLEPIHATQGARSKHRPQPLDAVDPEGDPVALTWILVPDHVAVQPSQPAKDRIVDARGLAFGQRGAQSFLGEQQRAQACNGHRARDVATRLVGEPERPFPRRTTTLPLLTGERAVDHVAP